MKIFAIGDLHLSKAVSKPMDIFGGQWDNYWENIQSDWRERVTDEDLVLIPGDISWAMRLDEALPDLEEIAALPGKKVIIRGNHDYWWSSYSKVKEALPPRVCAIQNDASKFGNTVIAGTRGWTIPDKNSTDADIKIYEREKGRFKLTLEYAMRLKGQDDTLYVMTHYPPFNFAMANSEITDIISAYPVKAVVYGHLHGNDCRANYLAVKDGIEYYLTSCDLVKNKLVAIS